MSDAPVRTAALNVSGLRDEARRECRRRGLSSSWTVTARRAALVAFLEGGGTPASGGATIYLAPDLRRAIDHAVAAALAQRTA